MASLQVPQRVLFILLAAAVAVAQQAGPEGLREEALTPEQFREAHAPLVQPRGTRAEAAASAFPPGQRALLEAYRDGVNAGLEALGAAPFEYLLLGSRPAPWRIEDSLLSVAAMFFVLNDASGTHEARTGAFEAALPPGLAAFLNPLGTDQDAPLVGPVFEVPPVPGPELLAAARGGAASAAPRVRSSGGPPPVSGSNSWAVSGEHTADGRPLVSSDMHLTLRVPGTWFRVEVRHGSRRFAGLTLPGVPALVAGSNGSVAWAFTNSSGDWTDLVELELDPDDPDRYRAPDGWRAMDRFEETIGVAGGEPQTHVVRETLWGPVTEAWGRPMAIRWIAHDPAAFQPAYLEFAHAGHVEDMFRVGRGSGMPPQNLVAADTAGGLGWSITGPMPRRRGLSGRTPQSWADGGRGWDGFLAAEEVPAIRDPESGRIWTANNRIVDGVWLDRLGRGGVYAHGERARLIRDRLLGIEAADAEALLSIQLEDRAPELGAWRALFLDALRGSEAPLAVEAAQLLREDWNGRADPASAAYPLVRNARVRLFEKIYGELTRPAAALLPSFSPWFAMQWPGPLLRLARERPAHFLPQGTEDWDELLAGALVETARDMAGEGPLAEQTWGRANRVHLRHPLSAGLPWFLSRLLGERLDAPPRGLPGDTGLPRSQRGTHGASNRFTVSPGHEEDGLLHMPGGQAGHFLSPYYLGGHEDWEEGRPTPFLPGPAEWTLTLTPS